MKAQTLSSTLDHVYILVHVHFTLLVLQLIEQRLGDRLVYWYLSQAIFNQ